MRKMKRRNSDKRNSDRNDGGNEQESLSSHIQLLRQPQSSTGSSSCPSESAADPLLLYSSNIAAACEAANELRQTQKDSRALGNTLEDEQKRRQRASSRLTAWQSRERKRIEFEVLQEREEELKRRNAQFREDNKRLRIAIEDLKGSVTAESSPTFSMPNQPGLANEFLDMQPSQNMKRDQSPISNQALYGASVQNVSWDQRKILPGPQMEKRGFAQPDFHSNLESIPPFTGGQTNPPWMNQEEEMPRPATGGFSQGSLAQYLAGGTVTLSNSGLPQGSTSQQQRFPSNFGVMNHPSAFGHEQTLPQDAAAQESSAGNQAYSPNLSHFNPMMSFISAFNSGAMMQMPNVSNFLNAAVMEQGKVDAPLFRAFDGSTTTEQHHVSEGTRDRPSKRSKTDDTPRSKSTNTAPRDAGETSQPSDAAVVPTVEEGTPGALGEDLFLSSFSSNEEEKIQ